MTKHIHTIMTTIGVMIFLLTLSEIIDIVLGDFYGSLYYWFLWLGGVLFVYGLGNLVKKINKNNQK